MNKHDTFTNLDRGSRISIDNKVDEFRVVEIDSDPRHKGEIKIRIEHPKTDGVYDGTYDIHIACVCRKQYSHVLKNHDDILLEKSRVKKQEFECPKCGMTLEMGYEIVQTETSRR